MESSPFALDHNINHPIAQRANACYNKIKGEVKMKTLYLIGGTMGVGKTTVCNTLKKDLENAVFLDGDWCWDLHPFRVTPALQDMVMKNIHTMLTNFLLCPDIDNILFCWVMHQQSIVDDVLSGLSLEGVRVVNISLTCSPEALKIRLERDIQQGIRQPDILDRSIPRLGLYEGLSTLKIDTTDRMPGEIAAMIRQKGMKE
jgi:chloramphenicol 3-O-phosphotransferase